MVFLCETKANINELNLQILGSSERYIDSKIREIGDNHHWRFTSFYGYLEIEDRHLSWNLFRSLATANLFPWVVGGDFNELFQPNEKVIDYNLRFKEAISDCNLHDLGFDGPPFTWVTTRGGGIKEKLDRFLTSTTWNDLFIDFRVSHLDPSKSNHMPLTLSFDGTRAN